jgi:hypothetical protein
MEGEPGGDQRCDDQEKADISKAAVHVFEVRDLHLTGLLTLFVLLGWGGAGRRHRDIIAYSFACCAMCNLALAAKRKGTGGLSAACFLLRCDAMDQDR